MRRGAAIAGKKELSGKPIYWIIKLRKIAHMSKALMFADFGGSEGGLSPLMVSEKLAQK